MSRRGLAILGLVGLLSAPGCRPAEKPGAASAPKTPGGEGLAEAKALLEQGQLDAALARLQEVPSGSDAFYLQGAVWAKKAESAPLPTPPPAPPGVRGNDRARAPEFKPEELRALEFFEKAVGFRLDHPQANLAIADLLVPHATRRLDLEQGSRPAATGRHRPKNAPSLFPRVEGEPDFSPERIMTAYKMAAQGDAGAQAPVMAWLAFAQRAGRVEDMDEAFRELLKRDKENPEPIIRYGDFLLKQRRDAPGAVTQYRQALIWRADDDATRTKIAEIYIGLGVESFNKQQYAVAQTHFLEAQKYITDKTSPEARAIQEHLSRLGAIRSR